jgi:hypothetical protein
VFNLVCEQATLLMAWRTGVAAVAMYVLPPPMTARIEAEWTDNLPK